MKDISALLKEAKPLYFARKRRNNRIKAACLSLGVLAAVLAFVPPRYDFETLEAFDYTGSVIQDMGLPTDDFGLLKVV